MFVNTREFKREGLYYKKHKKYDCGLKGSKSFKDFWDRERDRCLYGYKIGDLWITGYHYYYLNYCQIQRNEDTFGVVSETKGAAVRKVDFPDFWDIDYKFFISCHIARWGVQSLDPLKEWDYNRGLEEYKKLPIDLGIIEKKENLSGGKHILWLKPRGVGASYKAASMASRNFHLIGNMNNFMFADDKEYLTKDGILTKFIQYKSFLDNHTEFGATCEIKESLTDMHYEASYLNTQGNKDGLGSTLLGVTFKNNPEKARGKRGILSLWEEFGKFPNVTEAWNIARSSFEELNYVFGLMVGFGTGGSEGANFYGMEVMSSNPEAYNLLEFNNTFDDGMLGTSCSLFTPAYYNVSNKDKNGNSDIAKSKELIDRERRKALISPDPTLIERVKAEHPYTPTEAMLNTASNLFMVKGIGDWKNRIISDKKIRSLGIPKELVYDEKTGEINSILNEKHKPIVEYPHNSKNDIFGSVVEWATPYKIDGKVPDNLYIIGHDPFAEDDVEDTTSLGAAYVYMNPNNITPFDMGDRVVASWIGRPESTDEYNSILFLLAERWNAKIGFENDRGDVLGFAKRLNKLHLLADEFDLAFDEKIITKRKSIYKYGMRIGSGKTNVRILTGNRYIADWLKTVRTYNDKGLPSYNYHTIFDIALLKELVAYDGKKNADRVSAFRILMYHAKELAYNGTLERNKNVRRSLKSSPKSVFFNRN